MFVNQKISEGLALMASINGVSQAAGTVSSGWVPMAHVYRLLAQVQVGVFGSSATVDAKLQQATDNAGAGAKDISGKAITQLLAAGGNNRQVLINLHSEELDVNNSFNHVQLSITVGTAATLVSGSVWALPAYEDASALNAASVAQIV